MRRHVLPIIDWILMALAKAARVLCLERELRQQQIKGHCACSIIEQTGYVLADGRGKVPAMNS
jgi:hypothetical protein